MSSLSTTVAKKADASTVNTALADVWKKIYPVGAIYVSVSATNPAILFGGTWQQITGRFLLAAGGGYTAGATGGEASHTLTVAEMPSHTHAVANSSNSQLIGWSGHNNVSISITSWGAGNACNESKISAAGGSVAHNNMPPYLVVYMWRRAS
ncbi:MAG: hypothetical protein HFI33_13445 [Lachnospiraceae bacterium]|nr:hypothetical protein [Lachnospiraceae bacterium]